MNHDATDLFGLPEPTERDCSGGCGTRMIAPGPVYCSACKAKAIAADTARATKLGIQDAINSIPTSFRWATYGSGELGPRLGPSSPDVSGTQRALQIYFRDGVTIVGASGKGKTSIACAIFRRFLEDESFPLEWRRLSRFMSARDVGSDPPVAFRRPLVVLDDLGAELDTATARGTVSNFLADRIAWDHPTIVTTWLDERAVATRYGDGIARRLFERMPEIRFR